MRERLALSVLGASLCALAVGCASPARELDRVAKDWCLTIRASQVLPVYPLSEDVRPGDVFVVPNTALEQARIYEEKGFLSLDQRVTRLHDLPYEEYYAGGFSGLPRAAAPPEGGSEAEGAGALALPRAAFPSYNFEVTRSAGLKIALPLQGVASGLGLMGAEKAVGTVTIRDAYTYGVASDSVLIAFDKWWTSSEHIQNMLKSVAAQINETVYLRVVTRVYLTGGVTVSMTNLSSSGAGADVGAAPQIDLINLAAEDPEAAEAGAVAYSKVLEVLSGKLNSNAPGGAFRFVQASSRAVTLDENFDRPLVIGYRGFDLQVYRDGSLSAPLPSFATMRGESAAGSLTRDDTTDRLDTWIDEDEANYDLLEQWLERQGPGPEGLLQPSPAELIYGAEYAEMRGKAVKALLD